MSIWQWVALISAAWVAVSITLAIVWHRAAKRRPRVVFNSQQSVHNIDVRHHDLRGRY